MSLVTTPKGDCLLAFHPGDVLEIPETERDIPLPLALVAAHHQGKTLKGKSTSASVHIVTPSASASHDVCDHLHV